MKKTLLRTVISTFAAMAFALLNVDAQRRGEPPPPPPPLEPGASQADADKALVALPILPFPPIVP